MNFDWNNIADVVFHHAAVRPDDEAVRAGVQALTWARLAEAVDDATAFLAGEGIVEGETVGLALANSLEHVILLLGLMRLGATPLGFPPETPPPAISAVVRAVGARVLFVEAPERQAPAPRTIRVPPHWRPAAAAGRYRHATLPADRLVATFLSSGSTGVPRTVPLTHKALLERARISHPVHARWWSQARPGTALIAGALSHAAFVQWLIQQALFGGRTVLMPVNVHGGDVVREVAQWDGAVLRTVPNACRLFLQAAPDEGVLFPRLQLLNCTGLPLHPHEKRELVRRVTPHFSEDYGATGVGPIACLDPDEIAAKPESVGRPPPGVEVRLLDGQGGPAPPGMPGRIEVRSAGMVPRALQDRAAGNAFEGFHDGWCRTGDVARLDAQGYLHFVGRAAERIRQDGIDLYPEEIEGVLASYPGVGDVAVVGYTPVGAPSEVAIAIVGGIDYARRFDVAAHCAAHLPAERRPKSYLFTAQLPLTAAGKIDRPALKAHLAANPPTLSA